MEEGTRAMDPMCALESGVAHPPVLAAEAEVPAFATLQSDRSSKKGNRERNQQY